MGTAVGVAGVVTPDDTGDPGTVVVAAVPVAPDVAVAVVTVVVEPPDVVAGIAGTAEAAADADAGSDTLTDAVVGVAGAVSEIWTNRRAKERQDSWISKSNRHAGHKVIFPHLLPQ